MKRRYALILITAAMLTACVQSSEELPDIYTEESTSIVCDTSAPETTSETESETTVTQTETSSETETASETTAETETVTEIISSEDMTEQFSSDTETVTESESETSSAAAVEETTITETSVSEQTAAIPVTTETTVGTSAASAAEIVVPKVNTGNFSGENVISSDLVTVDISDVKNGVYKVHYNGSNGVKIRVTNGSTQYDYDYVPGGTNVYPLQLGSGSYTIGVYEHASGKSYAKILESDFSVSLSDSFRPFLMPTQFINYNGSSKCVYKAAELCAGKTKDIDKAAAIFRYITENVTYDKQLAQNVQSGYIPDPDGTLASKKGICFDYASLMAAMCRSQGIPTKLVMGYVKNNVYHAWNEIYIEEAGWISVDIYLASKGYNLVDPTFYASAGDKNAAVEYIGNGTNYSAVLYY